MSNRLHIIINFVGFQIGWIACVLMAEKQLPIIGSSLALLIVSLHFLLIKNRLSSLGLLVSATLLGTIWDSLLTSQQILVFTSGMIMPDMAPSWIIAMWMLFATTLNVSLRWLYGRYVLASILGAIAGPLAYQAGAALGAVSIPDSLTANITLCMGWAVILPLLIFLAESFENTQKSWSSLNEH